MNRYDAMSEALDSAAAYMQAWHCSVCATPVEHECQYPDYSAEVLFQFDKLTETPTLTVPNNFERVVEWSPAYNRKAEGYGIHGMEVRFVLKGEKGAVQ